MEGCAVSDPSSVIVPTRRIFISEKRSAIALIHVYSFFCTVFHVNWNSFSNLPHHETDSYRNSLQRLSQDGFSKASILIEFAKDSASRETAEDAAHTLVEYIKNSWAELAEIWRSKKRLVIVISVDPSHSFPPAQDQDVITRTAIGAAKFQSKISSGNWTCSDVIEYADVMSPSLDPILTFFELPPYIAHLRSLAAWLEKFEEQGKRIHPELNIVNDRSRSQLLGIISALINVQPGEMMKLKKPEEWAGYVDVALQMRSKFSDPMGDHLLPAPDEISTPYYIDLDQAAALVNRSKRTLERKLGEMPQPVVRGSGGTKSEWLWSDIAPWLEKKYGKKMPPVPPHAARH
jgi:hypothetical protein